MNELTRYKYELARMYEHCKDIEDFKKRNHYDYDLMAEDKMVYKACLMSLAQIGEHCVRLRKKNNTYLNEIEIPYKSIIAVRDIITHGYSQVDKDIYKDIIQNDIPNIIKTIENQVKSEVLKNPYILYEVEYDDVRQ